jgi:hypothetical protein
MQLRNPSVNVYTTAKNILDSCSALEDQLMLVEGLLLKLREEYGSDYALHSGYYEEYVGKKLKASDGQDLELYQKNCKTFSKRAVKSLDGMLRLFHTSLRRAIVGYHKERGFTGEWYWDKKKEDGQR